MVQCDRAAWGRIQTSLDRWRRWSDRGDSAVVRIPSVTGADPPGKPVNPLAQKTRWAAKEATTAASRVHGHGAGQRALRPPIEIVNTQDGRDHCIGAASAWGDRASESRDAPTESCHLSK